VPLSPSALYIWTKQIVFRVLGISDELSEQAHASKRTLIIKQHLMQGKVMTFSIIGWIFGIAVFAAGVVNTFWGNDPGFGIFLLLLSFVYFPPTSNLLRAISKRLIGFPIPKAAKIVLGIFIVWATLGMGELFDKINLMMMDL
jgi:hypothetical protein